MNNKTTNKKENIIDYYGYIRYDSYEELAFLQWAQELQDRDFIISIDRMDSYELSGEVLYNYIRKNKRGETTKEGRVFHSHLYTPDYKIMWNEKACGIFYWDIDSNTKKDKIIISQGYTPVSIIEVKPDFDQNNMERAARINIKWVYKEYNDIVTIVKPKKLFAETFTPKEYLLTKTGKKRKINWEVRTLDECIEMNKNTVNGENLYKCTSVEG